MSNGFLPISKEDMAREGIEQLDFVYVSGDAYVDHASFGTAIIARVLQSHGFKVGIIAQPDWTKPESIDILGEPSNLAEIELILATTTTLGKLGFKGFEIRINERRILKAMAAYSGFRDEDYDSVFITLDKMDKIGLEGVEKELKEAG